MTPFDAHAKQLRFRYAALLVMHIKASICMHPRFSSMRESLKTYFRFKNVGPSVSNVAVVISILVFITLTFLIFLSLLFWKFSSV